MHDRTNRWFRWALIAAAVAVVAWGFVTRYRQPGFQSRDCQVLSVLDGDTLLADCEGREAAIRLYCIDAAERAQAPWGDAARKRLRRLLPRGTRITVLQYDTDRYGRMVGEILKGRQNIDRTLVREGRAVVYPKYCDRREHPGYYADQQRARQARRGVWQRPGPQQTPWLFRQEQAREAEDFRP